MTFRHLVIAACMCILGASVARAELGAVAADPQQAGYSVKDSEYISPQERVEEIKRREFKDAMRRNAERCQQGDPVACQWLREHKQG